MIRAATLPIDVNLYRFSQFMQSQGIAHRINEESGKQVIWVQSEQHAALIQGALESWSFDEEAATQDRLSQQPSHGINPLRLLAQLILAFGRAPVSFVLITACLFVAFLSYLGAEPQRVAMLFYPRLDTSGLWPLIASIDSPIALLRTFAPMLLHFGELHIVFNMLWLWYFGRQLESAHPTWLYLILILFCSFAGNTAQYLYSGYNNFGGMSGVVYGLVGYTWVVHTFMPRSRLAINTKMFMVFVVALIFMEFLASSWIANAAHAGGLVAGLVLGASVVAVYRFVLSQDSIGRA